MGQRTLFIGFVDNRDSRSAGRIDYLRRDITGTREIRANDYVSGSLDAQVALLVPQKTWLVDAD